MLKQEPRRSKKKDKLTKETPEARFSLERTLSRGSFYLSKLLYKNKSTERCKKRVALRTATSSLGTVALAQQ